MRLKEDFNRIILQETPVSLWLFGLFFASVGGVIAYGSLGGFTDYDEIPRWQILLAFFMSLCAIATGIWIIYNAPLTRIVVDREKKFVNERRFGLFGRRETNYTFEQLKKFVLIEEKDDEGDLIWSLGMQLTSGETIKISALASRSEKFKRDFVFQINEFLHKPIPSYQHIELLEDESGAKMS